MSIVKTSIQKMKAQTYTSLKIAKFRNKQIHIQHEEWTASWKITSQSQTRSLCEDAIKFLVFVLPVEKFLICSRTDLPLLLPVAARAKNRELPPLNGVCVAVGRKLLVPDIHLRQLVGGLSSSRRSAQTP
jgi:hypothetical protein